MGSLWRKLDVVSLARRVRALSCFWVVVVVHCASRQEQNLAPSTLPGASGFDVEMLDRAINPCTDFYEYVCGKWMAANPIPADRSVWDRFDQLEQRNKYILRDILEKAADEAPPDAHEHSQIGDYFHSCMDEPSINQKGSLPLEPFLNEIASIKSRAELPGLIASLQNKGVGVLFDFSAQPDMENSRLTIADVDQGGIGLPDRDYYTRRGQAAVVLRAQYVLHVQRMFQLLGNPPTRASAKANVVLAIETGLAKGSLDAVSRRDPHKRYHIVSLKQANSMSPHFDWTRYLGFQTVPRIKLLNIGSPEFVKTMDKVIATHSLDGVKAYLSWRTVSAFASVMSTPFVDEDFNFYGKVLRGEEKIRPRWERCVDLTNEDLGDELGRAYVNLMFDQDSKERVGAIIRGLETALREDIQKLSWMGEGTKVQALEKLDATLKKVGYPDKWRDSSALFVARDDALGNRVRAKQFSQQHRLAKIGQPLDRAEWPEFLTPSIVDAHEDPQMNAIEVPAGILQPPFFDKSMDQPLNFGAIGAVIGHELTHGFDDEGRQFDASGNLRDWWTSNDSRDFNERAQCLVEEYGKFVAIDDQHVNGKLTLGENVADNGGLRVALIALRNTIGELQTPSRDGFTAEQRFFLGWGQFWCRNERSERVRVDLLNEHAPMRYRVNGVLSNFPEFRRAFKCGPSDAMVRQNACRVW